MNKIKLDIDYKRKPEDVAKASNVSISIDYINFFVGASNKEGLKGQMSRIWGRIQRKLDAAEESKATFVELEEAEYDFISKCIKSDDVLYPVNLSKYFLTFESEVFSLNNESKN